MTSLKIAVAGASGRMGQMLVEAIGTAPDAALSGALDVAASPAVGSDAGAFAGKPVGVAITADLAAGLAGADVLIDFTRPEGTLKHLAYCAEHGIKLVIGTTGFDDAGKAAIRAAAEKTAIVFAPNMSVGVNVTLKLLQMAAKSLAEGYDIEISHKSSSRVTYAHGALRAARFLADKSTGLFDMQDVLALDAH